MIKTRLGVFSPYPEFTELAREVSRQFDGVEILLEEKILDEAVETAMDWEEKGLVDVIVARSPTAHLIAPKVSLPVSAVEITDFDIIKTLYQARSLYGESIVFISHDQGPARYDYDLYKKILGFDFKVCYFRDNQGFYNSVELARREGAKALVAPLTCIAAKAGAWKTNVMLVHSGYRPVYDAFVKALRMTELKKESTNFINRLCLVMNSINDGVIALDETGKVFFYNPVAEKLLGIKSKDVLNKNICQLAGYEVLKKIYHDGQKASGSLVRLDAGKELLVNRVTFKVGGGQCLVINFQVVSAIRQMEEKIRQELHAQGLVAKYSFSDICGDSELIQDTIEQARKFARSQSTVLISGESGTGKELLAQSIHNESGRRNGPFVAINCAALPETLLESELFGYEEGAFTGARRGGKLGLFEIAHGGSIFLDEIAELSPQLQARILRVVQQREVMRVGGQRVIPVDVRIITATNRNLFEAVQNGTFREDLFYRLNVLQLKIPPLRKRLEDLPALFHHFLARRGEKRVPSRVPQYITDMMKRYSWPGNVRELENFAERYYAIGEEDFDQFSTLKVLIGRMFGEDGGGSAGKHKIVVEIGTFDQIESQIIEQLATLFPNSKGDLAKALGISRTTLWRKLKASGCQLN